MRLIVKITFGKSYKRFFDGIKVENLPHNDSLLIPFNETGFPHDGIHVYRGEIKKHIHILEEPGSFLIECSKQKEENFIFCDINGKKLKSYRCDNKNEYYLVEREVVKIEKLKEDFFSIKFFYDEIFGCIELKETFGYIKKRNPTTWNFELSNPLHPRLEKFRKVCQDLSS